MSEKGSQDIIPVEDAAAEHSFDSERRLVRKIDWHLLPWICLLYALALIDRYAPPSGKVQANGSVNIGVARIAGMAVDIDLKGNHYNVALLVFFPGYALSMTC